MSEVIEREKESYKKLYTDLVFAYDDLRMMLDEEELEKRTFIDKVNTLKEYMYFLDDLESDNKNEKGLFKKLFNNDREEEAKIDRYLTEERLQKLRKLEKCNQCECRSCVRTCNMNQCYNCMEQEYVHGCNKSNLLMTKSTDTVTLYTEDGEFKFNIAGYLIERNEDEDLIRYVYLIDKNDYDNQHILKYYKFKGEEYYDSVIDGYCQDLLEEINNKFIEMGLRV